MSTPADVALPPSVAPPARIGLFNLFHILVRRELWEHRVLWIAPLVVAALYLLACMVPGNFSFGNMDVSTSVMDGTLSLIMGAEVVFARLLFILMSVVIFFYLSDCLYAERKDRSILFWKSLPVSDSATVLSKLLLALVVVPVGLYLLALVTTLAAAAILFLRLHGNPAIAHLASGSPVEWLGLNAALLADVLILSLWYAPVVAYQLLVSAWARSAVFVWTILPPLALVLGERAIFHSWNVGMLIAQRLGTGFTTVSGQHNAGITVQAGELFNRIDALGLLASAQLWVGLAVAAALVFATIRVRRFRDDG